MSNKTYGDLSDEMIDKLVLRLTGIRWTGRDTFSILVLPKMKLEDYYPEKIPTNLHVIEKHFKILEEEES